MDYDNKGKFVVPYTMDYDNKGKIVPYMSLETYITSHQIKIESHIKAVQHFFINHGYSCVVDQKLANFFIKHFAFRLRDLGHFVCFGDHRSYEKESVDPDNFTMSRPQVMKWFRQTITWKRPNTFIVNEDYSEILDEPVGEELYLISDDDFFLKYFLKYFKGEPVEGDKKYNERLYSYRNIRDGIRIRLETSIEHEKQLLILRWDNYSINYIRKCTWYYKMNKPKLNDLDDEEKEEEWNTVLKNMKIAKESRDYGIRSKAEGTIKLLEKKLREL
jgi:hypothetical protein